MSIWLIYAGYVAAVNPARLRPALPGSEDGAEPFPALAGAAAAFVVCLAVVAFSTDVLSALDITPETARIAAGMVAALVGFRVLVSPTRTSEPRLGGNLAAVVPVAFPLLLTPELVALVLIFGATEPAARSVGGLGLALLVGVFAARMAHRRPTVWLASARLLAAVLILVGVALIVEGIRDV